MTKTIRREILIPQPREQVWRAHDSVVRLQRGGLVLGVTMNAVLGRPGGDTEMLDLINDIIDLSWNVSQSNKITELNREVDRLKQSARSSSGTDPIRAQLEELRAANGELRLYIAVLFRALNLKGILGRDDLAKLVEQIDEEDGRRDRAHVGDVLP